MFHRLLGILNLTVIQIWWKKIYLKLRLVYFSFVLSCDWSSRKLSVVYLYNTFYAYAFNTQDTSTRKWKYLSEWAEEGEQTCIWSFLQKYPSAKSNFIWDDGYKMREGRCAMVEEFYILKHNLKGQKLEGIFCFVLKKRYEKTWNLETKNHL